MHLKISDLVLVNNHQFIILNKPAGIPSVRDKSDEKSIIDIAEIYCKQKLRPVNRLDRPASGLIIFAKSKLAASNLSNLLKDGKITKNYLAFVSNPSTLSEVGELNDFVIVNNKINKAFLASENDSESKQASLQYKVIEKNERYALVWIKLISGRHHQIRAQFANAGHPIKGDVKYGFRRSNTDRSIDLLSFRLKFEYNGLPFEAKASLPPTKIWQDHEQNILEFLQKEIK